MRRALAPMGSSAEQFAGCLHKCLGVEMHILHACRGLHVARRGSVELKLPMPGLDPCLASWLLAGRKRGVLLAHVRQAWLLTKDISHLLVVTGRASEPR